MIFVMKQIAARFVFIFKPGFREIAVHNSRAGRILPNTEI